MKQGLIKMHKCAPVSATSWLRAVPMIYQITSTIGNSVGFITIATSEMGLDEEESGV